MHPFRAISTLALLALIGCTGTIDVGASGANRPEISPLDPTPGGRNMTRITNAEYRQSVLDVLETSSTGPLPDDARSLGSVRLGAGSSSVSSSAAVTYEAEAGAVSRRAFSDAGRARRLTGCTPTGVVDDGCATIAVDRLGLRLFRRPLSVEERGRFVSLAGVAAAHVDSFDGGLGLAISGMLQSPSFLFHIEHGEPVGETRARYTGYEVAARLASLLWASVPDQALLDAAARGDLDTIEGITATLPRLHADPRAHAAMVALVMELFDFGRLHALVSDEGGTAGLADAMLEETRRVLEDALFVNEIRYRDLFDLDSTFVNRALAERYGMPAVSGSDFVSTPLPEGRRGILSLGAFLASHGKGGNTSPTLRGFFVRTRLLCETIAPPPPGVSTELDSGAGATARDRLSPHRASPACASCHNRMDPIGLGLEQFDGLGQFRRTEGGEPIDPSGELDGLPFEDARALGEVLRDHPALDACVTRRMFRSAMGRMESRSEEAALRALTEDFVARGGTLRDLFDVLVTSDAFRFFEVQP